MKKIMIAAAIAAYCGAVSATGIESQNVVGYTVTGMTRGEFNYHVATFLPIGKDPSEMTLGDLQFENLKVSEIQLLEDGGNTMVLEAIRWCLTLMNIRS